MRVARASGSVGGRMAETRLQQEGEVSGRRRGFEAGGGGSQQAQRKHDGGGEQLPAVRPREVFTAGVEGGIPSV